jgi:hypothetical protein
MGEKVNFLTLFKSDKTIEEKGIVLEFGDASFTVKRASKSNKAYTVAMSNYMKKNKFQIENEMISEEKLTPALAKIYFDTVSLGWENVVDPKTNEVLPYTEANFVKIMSEYPEFFDAYREQCQLRTNFAEKMGEVEAKN